MREATDQAADTKGRLAHHLTTIEATADASTDETIRCGVTADDLPAVAACLSVINENAYQLAVLAANAVKSADPQYPIRSGSTGFSIYGSLDHVTSLYAAVGSFIERTGHDLRELDHGHVR